MSARFGHLNIQAYDGDFTKLKEPHPRQCPYLYLTQDGMTLMIQVETENQLAALLAEMVRLATYFASWQESKKDEAAA